MFKDNFERLLQTHNVKAYAVAKATGISQGLLSEYKSGKKEPSIPNLQKLADYFDVTVDDLLGNKNSPAEDGEADMVATTPAERELLRLLRSFPEEDQARILAAIETLLRTQELQK